MIDRPASADAAEVDTDAVEPVHVDDVGPMRPARYAIGKLALVAAALLGLLVALGALVQHVLPGTPVGELDEAAEGLRDQRTKTLTSVTYWITQLAQTTTVVALAIIVVIVLFVVSRRWQQPLFVAATLIGEVVIFLIATLLVHRTRPDAAFQLDEAPPTSSFPSGHTAAAVAMYGGLAVVVARSNWRRLLKVVLVLLLVAVPICVALSRVYRGMHYPTDVLGGFLLGGLWLMATTAILWPGRR